MASTGAPIEIYRRPGRAEADRQRFSRRRRRTDLALRLGAPLLFFAAWQVAAVTETIPRQFWPAPTDVVGALRGAVENGALQDALAVSLRRLLVGFTAGSVIGMTTGLLLGAVRPLRVAIEPLISALYTIPKLAVLPLLMLVFGFGDTPILILIAMSSFFLVAISTTAAVVGVSDAYLDAVRTFGGGQFQAWRHVVVPAVMPEVFVALRLSAGMSVLTLVGIEFVQGGEGLGWLIWGSWEYLNTERMYVGIITVAVLGVLFQSLIKLLGRIVCPWAETKRS